MTATTAKQPSRFLEVDQWLRKVGIVPTRQRLQIATALFNYDGHLSAQALYRLINRDQSIACRATVYNTLHLFVSHGLIREISVDSSQSFYDPNTKPHHHIFNIDTGELLDVEPESVAFKALPDLPDGMKQEEITLIIRVRNAPGVRRPLAKQDQE